MTPSAPEKELHFDSLTDVNTYPLIINNGDKDILRLHMDGTLEIDPINTQEAAHQFVAWVKEMWMAVEKERESQL